MSWNRASEIWDKVVLIFAAVLRLALLVMVAAGVWNEDYTLSILAVLMLIFLQLIDITDQLEGER